MRWIEAPDSAGLPAPTIDVTTQGGALEDVAGSKAGPAPSPGGGTGAGAPAGTKAVMAGKGAGKGLGMAGLIVGGLGLLLAIAALASGRARQA